VSAQNGRNFRAAACGLISKGTVTDCAQDISLTDLPLLDSRCYIVNPQRKYIAYSNLDYITFSLGVMWNWAALVNNRIATSIDSAKRGAPVRALINIHHDANFLDGTVMITNPIQEIVILLSTTSFTQRNGSITYNYGGVTSSFPSETLVCHDSLKPNYADIENTCVGFITVNVQFQNLRVQKIKEISKDYAYYEFVGQIGGAISLVLGIASFIFGNCVNRCLFRKYTDRAVNEQREATLYLIQEQLGTSHNGNTVSS